MLIDTIGELFAGNQALFEGLHIYDKWNWSIKYPVIRISFGGGVVKNIEDLNQPIHLIGVEFSKESRSVVGFEVHSIG